MPTDANGEPVYAVAGYCAPEDCETRWHQELVSTLAKLDPIPTRLRCPLCQRYLSPPGAPPYALRKHWPVTGEGSDCPFHPNVIRRDFTVQFSLPLPRSAAEFVATRCKARAKFKPRVHRRMSTTKRAR